MTGERPAWAARIQAEREARRWTKAEMARQLQAADGNPGGPTESLVRQIRGWENGAHEPRDWTGPYARAFGLSEAELFGITRRQPRAIAKPRTIRTIPAGPVAPELVDYFRDQLAGHYLADRHLGPLRLIPTAATQYELLCELANAAAGGVRAELWAVAAGYSGLIGWLYQDGGDLDLSLRWHDTMIERAHRSLNTQLVAWALHNKAMLHIDLGDGPGAADLSRAALAQSAPIAKVRVLALQQLVHGISLSGRQSDRAECDQLLDEAVGLVDQIDDAYPWGGAASSPNYVETQRATCYVRLGLAEEALALWESVMSSAVGVGRRDLGVFMARQAQALALLGEPDEAVTVAEQVADIARETGSVRMRRELVTLQARMAPWAKDTAGRQLGDVLHAIGD